MRNHVGQNEHRPTETSSRISSSTAPRAAGSSSTKTETMGSMGTDGHRVDHDQRPGESEVGEEESHVSRRLKFYFAILSCLGGLVLGSAEETQSLPILAVFFAIFGYICVDWLKLFALPAVAAYALMGLAALFCVSDFANLERPGNQQIVAVAELLVFVQAILMLQQKTHRIYEQLGVFCLLQLIVAAVFNNAINYGLILIPIGIIGAWALSLLAALASSQESTARDAEYTSPLIRCWSNESAASMARATRRVSFVALFTVAPAVLLVSVIFFYALPRTIDAGKATGAGNTLVGFSEDLRLGEIGQMLQSDQTALRIRLTDQRTRRPYKVAGGLYLRGRVLERYQARLSDDHGSYRWTVVANRGLMGYSRLPSQFFPKRVSDDNFYDAVQAQVTCESMRSPALFAVAPYHATHRNDELVHRIDRWTLRRAQEDPETLGFTWPRITYSFGTHGFSGGMQSELTTRFSELAPWPSESDDAGSSRQDRARSQQAYQIAERNRQYLKLLTEFDEQRLPTAKRLAASVIDPHASSPPSTYEIAKRLERMLAVTGGFSYTLSLTAKPIPGVDPIEQFLAVERRGHCQYFASALAMMLRSLDIPARLVVGYHTDEYNELGGYYVARQLHAHAWVEALIPKDQLPAGTMIYGQRPSQEYWLRLDPTPGGGGNEGAVPPSGVDHVLDVAQDLWDNYVVDMDAERQQDAILGAQDATTLTASYEHLVDVVKSFLQRINTGELGGGSLAGRELFSWRGAIAGVLATLVVFALLRLKLTGWIRRRLVIGGSVQVARPSLAFYADALDQVARLGLHRAGSQTPAEFTRQAAASLPAGEQQAFAGPLDALTAAFYRLRFAAVDPDEIHRAGAEMQRTLDRLKQEVDRLSVADPISIQRSTPVSESVPTGESMRADESSTTRNVGTEKAGPKA